MLRSRLVRNLVTLRTARLGSGATARSRPAVAFIADFELEGLVSGSETRKFSQCSEFETPNAELPIGTVFNVMMSDSRDYLKWETTYTV